MSSAPPQPAAPRSADLARHRAILRRLLIVHFVAYLPSFAAALAGIPLAVEFAIDRGVRDDESEIFAVVIAAALVGFVMVFVLSHATGIRWVLDRGERGRRLALHLPIAAALGLGLAGALAWLRLLY